MDAGVHTCPGSAASVPEPTITTSATARSMPMTMRSCALKPLMSPPPEWPLLPSDTTPSRVLTKLLKT